MDPSTLVAINQESLKIIEYMKVKKLLIAYWGLIST